MFSCKDLIYNQYISLQLAAVEQQQYTKKNMKYVIGQVL